MFRIIFFLAIIIIMIVNMNHKPIYRQEIVFNEDFELGQGNWWTDNGILDAGMQQYSFGSKINQSCLRRWLRT